MNAKLEKSKITQKGAPMIGAPSLFQMWLAAGFGKPINNLKSVLVEPFIEALDKFFCHMQILSEVHRQSFCASFEFDRVNFVPECYEQRECLFILIIVPVIKDDTQRDSHILTGAEERIGERVARHVFSQIEQSGICQEEPMLHFQGAHS